MGNPTSKLIQMIESVRLGHHSGNELASHIFSFLDGQSYCRSTTVSSEFYALTTQKIHFPLQIFDETIVTDRYGDFKIKRTIDRKIAAEVFKQTGFEIVIPPGKEAINDFVIGRGMGSGGEIRLGFSSKTGKYVAIKITMGDNSITREVALHKALQTQLVSHILPRLGQKLVSLPSGRLMLYQILELGGLGSAEKLKHSIQSISDAQFRERLLFCCAEGLLRGLAEMHRAKFYHLDIKPDNLLVNQDGAVFLSDFGCSVTVPKKIILARKETGDRYYFSPERFMAENPIFSDKCDGEKIDAWAAGLTLLELADPTEFPFSQMEDYYLHGDQKLVAERMKQYVQRIKAGIAVLQNPLPDSFWSLVVDLLNFDPIQRKSPEMALSHPWYRKMEATAGKWRESTNNCLRELVHSLQRENRRRFTIETKPDCIALSPQELPLPHFANFRQNPKLIQQMIHSLSRDCQSQTQMTVFQGAGGVGKTLLANFIVHQKIIQERFGLILWFNSANNKDLIESQCFALAQEFELTRKGTPLPEVLKKLISRLEHYQKQTSKPWLMVFDNADDEELVRSCFPKAGGHVLVTTRLATWKNALPIDILSNEEALDLVCRLLQNQDPENQKLCMALGNLPLALVQACAYLRNQKISIQDYLAALQKASKAAAVLDSDERYLGKKLPSSISGIWGVTFETLSKHHAEALNILNCLSYLSPDGIPYKLLRLICNEETTKILQKYALLQFNPNEQHYTQHRLLQLAIRSKHSKEVTLQSLTFIINIINKLYSFEPRSVNERQDNHALFRTGEAVLLHCEKLESPSREVKLLYSEMIRWFAHLHGKMGQHNKQLELLSKAVAIRKECMGKISNEIAMLFNDIGSSWGMLGNFEKSIEYYKTALTNLDKADPKTAMEIEAYIHDNLGYAYKNLEKSNEALLHYENAYKLAEVCFGRGHFRVVKNLSNIAAIWGNLRNPGKAAEYNDRALSIQEERVIESPKEAAKRRYELAQCWFEEVHDKKKAADCCQKALRFLQEAGLSNSESLSIKISELLAKIEGKPIQFQAPSQAPLQASPQSPPVLPASDSRDPSKGVKLP